jgi:hypothetical protein
MSNPNSVIYSNVFLTDDCQKIFQNKFILFLGDSGINIFSSHTETVKIILYLFFFKVTRGIYKDLVKLLQSSHYLNNDQLKTKGEMKFENDVLLQGGCLGKLNILFILL